MALTTQQFQEWLEDANSIRCMLVEVTANIGGVETQLYLSNRNYVTNPTDTPASTAYIPILKTSVRFTENLSLDDSGSLSYGDISIDNTNGEYDSWLRAVWSGRPVRIYIGDPKFTRDNFTLIFTGIVASLTSSDRNTLSLQLRDKLEILNTPITEAVLGNYYQGSIVSTGIYDNPNKNQVKPLVFGEVFNITPLLIDPSTLTYMVHNGPIERIIEVRDNGVPLIDGSGYNTSLNSGTFTLLNSPAGTITCSVQGSKAGGLYINTPAALIKRIIKTYGNPGVAGTITDSDIDLANFASFESAHQQKMGIYISGKDNLLAVCQALASSVGAQMVCTRAGLIKLLKVDIPTAGSVIIDDEHIIKDSLTISQKPEVISSYKLGYCKNWTVQDKLLTGIPAEHKDLLAGDWLSVTYTNATSQQLYKLNALPELKETLLLTQNNNEVLSEAIRLTSLRSTQRYIYRFTCTPKFLQTQLGDMLTLKHARFGLDSGSPAQIISIEIDWDTGYVTMEALV